MPDSSPKLTRLEQTINDADKTLKRARHNRHPELEEVARLHLEMLECIEYEDGSYGIETPKDMFLLLQCAGDSLDELIDNINEE